jgi:dTDP-glucose 4,6-dehydratase
MNKYTFLVTGGAGFIGSCFVHQMVTQGHHVIVLDALTYAGHRANLEWIQGAGKWQLVVGSITDSQVLQPLFTQHKIDYVVNFAAESHVDNSIHASKIFIETNIVGVHTLLEATRDYYATLSKEQQQRFRLLHVSTDEVFGSLGATGAFEETTAYAPNSPYSASKAGGDHLVRAWYETYQLPTLITHCSNNYGPRQFPEKLIPCMITRALKGQSLTIYGDGLNVRDWIHVEDHCSGIALALWNGVIGERYCLGGRAERTNNEVVHAICHHLNRLRPRANQQRYEELITYVTDRAGHDRRYAINDDKAQRELGFKRQYDFEAGIAATIQWYLENEQWCQTVKE